jgi:nucleotide-binding universal stress UspA family protein
MKNILLPTDFSDNAWNAIFTARKLFSGEKCHFVILNCYAPRLENISGFKSSARTGAVISGLKQASEQGVSEVLSALDRQNKGNHHSFSTVSVKGDLAGQIKKLIPEYDLDLIVMGAKGATASRHIFLGSNTVAVIRKIRNCAVIGVPESYNFQTLKQVVFPTDYTHFYSKGVLRILLDLAGKWKATVLVVHFGREFMLTDDQRANMEVLQERLANVKSATDRIAMESTLSGAIANYAEDRMADMICLVHYEHTFLERLTREPAIKKVVFNSNVPLLVMPD